MLLDSLTEFLKLKGSLSSGNLDKKHPEFVLPKATSYYLFEKKTETYMKNDEEKSYEQTTRIDKGHKVNNIVQQLVDSGDSHLRHQRRFDNVVTVLPKIKERHTGKYIEVDFSENITLKAKNEVQEAHFLGKQYAMHCTIM